MFLNVMISTIKAATAKSAQSEQIIPLLAATYKRVENPDFSAEVLKDVLLNVLSVVSNDPASDTLVFAASDAISQFSVF